MVAAGVRERTGVAGGRPAVGGCAAEMGYYNGGAQQTSGEEVEEIEEVKEMSGMEYRQYGTEGPLVSRLGFGVMRLPPRRKGQGGTVNFTKSLAIMRQAMEGGVNFFDSHHGYHGGLSEVAIGRALKGWKGQRIYVQTKTPFYNEEPIDKFKKLLEEAVEKLGVDCIDYLLFHAMNMGTFKARGKQFLKFTDWAMKRRLIRHRGFSSHDAPKNIKRFVDTGEFAAMLVSYNWQNPGVAEAIAYAADKGMGVSVMNPLAGGLLSAETRQIRRLLPGAKSSAEIALRYVLGTPGVALALSGMNTAEQVAENVATAGRKTPLTATQRKVMTGRLAEIRKKSLKLCTACGYCMPCASGVDIPRNFTILNEARLLGLVDHARRQFERLRRDKNGDKSALACVKCGKCMPKCPNDVPIIAQLEEAASLLGKAAGTR